MIFVIRKRFMLDILVPDRNMVLTVVTILGFILTDYPTCYLSFFHKLYSYTRSFLFTCNKCEDINYLNSNYGNETMELGPERICNMGTVSQEGISVECQPSACRQYSLHNEDLWVGSLCSQAQVDQL